MPARMRTGTNVLFPLLLCQVDHGIIDNRIHKKQLIIDMISLFTSGGSKGSKQIKLGSRICGVKIKKDLVYI